MMTFETILCVIAVLLACLLALLQYKYGLNLTNNQANSGERKAIPSKDDRKQTATAQRSNRKPKNKKPVFQPQHIQQKQEQGEKQKLQRETQQNQQINNKLKINQVSQEIQQEEKNLKTQQDTSTVNNKQQSKEKKIKNNAKFSQQKNRKLSENCQNEDPKTAIEEAKNIVLLLGSLGVGKNTIMRRLFQKSDIEKFVPFSHAKISYNLAVASSFDFEENLDDRESQIKLYQQFFIHYGQYLQQFFIVVNFERTDLMRNKIISIYKYFRRFKNMITIVVTQFQQSENKDSDQILLSKAFKVFSERDIIFLHSEDTATQIADKFQYCLNNLTEKIKFDFSNTIFELENEKETQIMLKQLNMLTQRISSSTKKLKKQ